MKRLMLICWLMLVVATFAQAQEFGRFVDRTALWQRGRIVLSGFRNLYSFEVVRDEADSAFPWKVWCFGWAHTDCNQGFPGCDAIFFGRSKLLTHNYEFYAGPGKWVKTDFQQFRPVITADNAYYDQWHNGDPSLVKVGHTWYMAFSSTGFNKDGLPYGAKGDKDGGFDCIGGAISQDGIHWRKAKAPLLQHEADCGAPPEPEGDVHAWGSYLRPSLMRDEGKWKLWFDYWIPGEGIALGYAENKGEFLDPSDWHVIRAGNHPCIKQFPNPDVVKVGDLYFAYGDPGGYAKHPWRGRELLELASLDGLNWLPLGFIEADERGAASHVPQAIVKREGERTWIYVFYALQRGGEPYDYRYKAITYARRLVTASESARLHQVLRHYSSK